MKHVLSILMLWLLFSSCSKNNLASTKTQKSINRDLVSEIEELNSDPAKKIALNLLNENEKSLLWKEQISFYISSDLNQTQKNHLQKLLNFISSKIFIPEYKISDLESFSKPWEEVGRLIFPIALLNEIVSKVHTMQYVIDFVTQLNTREAKGLKSMPNLKETSQIAATNLVSSCGCSQRSDYCGLYEQCTTPVSPCTAKSLGCGFLGFYTCNGACKGGA